MYTVKAKMFQRIADLCQPAIQLAKGIILILDQDGKIISFNEFFVTIIPLLAHRDSNR